MSLDRLGLTGEIKYRKNWFGQFVVSVEENVRYIDDMNPHDIYGYSYKRWRDANMDDIIDLTKRGFIK